MESRLDPDRSCEMTSVSSQVVLVARVTRSGERAPPGRRGREKESHRTNQSSDDRMCECSSPTQAGQSGFG